MKISELIPPKDEELAAHLRYMEATYRSLDLEDLMECLVRSCQPRELMKWLEDLGRYSEVAWITSELNDSIMADPEELLRRSEGLDDQVQGFRNSYEYCKFSSSKPRLEELQKSILQALDEAVKYKEEIERRFTLEFRSKYLFITIKALLEEYHKRLEAIEANEGATPEANGGSDE